jgi:hypothetical protein
MEVTEMISVVIAALMVFQMLQVPERMPFLLSE